MLVASRAQISPNLALICVIHENCVGLVGGPLGDGESKWYSIQTFSLFNYELTSFCDPDLIRNLARHLAMATIRQTDTSDIIGRVIGLKATGSSIYCGSFYVLQKLTFFFPQLPSLPS